MEAKKPEDGKLEILLTYKNQTSTMYLDPESTMLKLREAIKNKFEFPKTNYFEVYAGNYHLNELFDNIPMEKLNEIFLGNKYNVLYYSDKEPFVVFKENKKFEDFLNFHKDTVEKYLEYYEVDLDLKECIKDMSSLKFNLEKIYDDMCKEEEYLKKKGLLALHDQLSLRLEKVTKRKNDLEAYLDTCFVKILELKKFEKIAIDYVKDNKKLVSSIHKNSVAIQKKKKIIENLKNHQTNLIRRRETESKMIESYITKKSRYNIIEKIKLRFYKIYKHTSLLKLIDNEHVLGYFYEKPKENQLELLKIDDSVGFSNHFSTQIKRDEFCLNFREKLLISMKHAVFVFDSKTLAMSRLKDLQDDHKGGSMIYVPQDNSIYCISGLMSVLVEKIKLTKKFEIPLEAPWETVNKLLCPRAYYSSYVKNDSIIYIMLGFNLWDNEYLATVDRYDVNEFQGEWKNIKLKGINPPRLSFTACIPVTDDDVYIFGGRDINDVDNTEIFYYNVRASEIDNANIQYIDEETLVNEKISLKNLYYHENSFLPMKTPDLDNEGPIPVAQYDSKGVLHIFNVKNFNYNYVDVNHFVNEEKTVIEENEQSVEGKNEESMQGSNKDEDADDNPNIFIKKKPTILLR